MLCNTDTMENALRYASNRAAGNKLGLAPVWAGAVRPLARRADETWTETDAFRPSHDTPVRIHDCAGRTAQSALPSKPGRRRRQSCRGGARRRCLTATAPQGHAGAAGRSSTQRPARTGPRRGGLSQPALPVLPPRQHRLRAQRLHQDHSRRERSRAAHRHRRQLWLADGRGSPPGARAEARTSDRPHRPARLHDGRYQARGYVSGPGRSNAQSSSVLLGPSGAVDERHCQQQLCGALRAHSERHG